MEKVIRNVSVEGSRQPYGSPRTDVLFVEAQGMLCLSGNVPAREYDYGDAGFGEI